MQKCMKCGGEATHEGWAYPAGGSFPVTGCEPCLDDLARDMDVRTSPLIAPDDPRLSTDRKPDRAKIVGRDLSEAAQRLAYDNGWEPHARMHPATAATYEERAHG